MKELPKEALDEAIEYAFINNKFTHCFEEKHKFFKLVEELGNKNKVLEAVLKACVGKIPAVGVFMDVPVEVSNVTVYVRGHVIDGVPKLGTMFIK